MLGCSPSPKKKPALSPPGSLSSWRAQARRTAWNWSAEMAPAARIHMHGRGHQCKKQTAVVLDLRSTAFVLGGSLGGCCCCFGASITVRLACAQVYWLGLVCSATLQDGVWSGLEPVSCIKCSNLLPNRPLLLLLWSLNCCCWTRFSTTPCCSNLAPKKHEACYQNNTNLLCSTYDGSFTT